MKAARTIGRLCALGLLAPVLLVGACGDDGPGRLSTGVDGTKPLGMVTPAEADQICKRSQTWIAKAVAEDKQRQLGCRVAGLVAAVAGSGLGGGGGGGGDAQLQAACKMASDTCLMMAPTTNPTMPASCQSFPAGCTATVAEYEACLNDIPPTVDMTLTALPTCDKVTTLGLLSLAGLANSIPMSCRTFQMKCSAVEIPGVPGIPTPGS
jgi:hypothetical protein